MDSFFWSTCSWQSLKRTKPEGTAFKCLLAPTPRCSSFLPQTSPAPALPQVFVHAPPAAGGSFHLHTTRNTFPVSLPLSHHHPFSRFAFFPSDCPVSFPFGIKHYYTGLCSHKSDCSLRENQPFWLRLSAPIIQRLVHSHLSYSWQLRQGRRSFLKNV